MPKEKLNHPNEWLHDKSKPGTEISRYHGEVLTDDQFIKRDTGVRLHWDKTDHGIVQFSVLLDVDNLRELIKQIDAGEWLGEETNKEVVAMYTGPLTRSDLQRTIKFARAARDEAFGADE